MNPKTPTCRCLPGPLPTGDATCAKCGKALDVNHEEVVRNRKLAQHSMKARRKQDQGLRIAFAKEKAREDAKKAELNLFTAMMEER